MPGHFNEDSGLLQPFQPLRGGKVSEFGVPVIVRRL